MARRLTFARSFLASAALLVTLSQIEPAAAQQLNEDEAKRRVWVASFVEGMRDDPKRFVEYYRAIQNASLAPWKKTVATILVDAPREVSNNVGFETFYNAVRIHHMYPHEKEDEYLAEDLLDKPEVAYNLAENAFYLLTNLKSKLSSVERGWQKVTKTAVADGTIPSTNLTFSQLVAQAPGGTVADVLNDKQVQAAAADREALKLVLEKRFGSIDGAQAAVLKSVSDNQKKIDHLTGEIQKVRDDQTAQAKKEALAKERAKLIAETRSGVYVASTLLSFLDPEAGRFVSVAGSAAIDASVAVASLMGTFSFAATGNLLGAGIQVAGLFGNKGGGAEAQRHAQIVEMLKAIRQQLIDIRKDMKIVDVKLDRALLEIELVQNGQVLQTTSLLNHLNDLQRSIGSSFTRVVEVGRDASRADHLIKQKQCLASFPLGRDQIRKEESNDGRRLTDCLAAYHAFGSQIARNTTWTLKNFDWVRGNRAELNSPTPLSYTGVVPAIATDLGQASGSPPPLRRSRSGRLGTLNQLLMR